MRSHEPSSETKEGSRKVLTGMIRRFSGVAAASSLVVFAGMATISMPTVASAATPGACAVNGSATINPGLGAVPGPQTVNYNGTASPCVGVAAGSFSGTVGCPLGGLVTCVGVASFTVTSSPIGSCSGGVLVQQGPVVEVACQTAGGAIVGAAVFTPNPLVQTTVSNVNFTGAAAGVV
jgi:hypothetical protein